MEEQKYYKLGEGRKIKKDNGRNHLVVVEGAKYQPRIFYINRRMEHNVARYARYYTLYRTFKTLRICNFPK
jgi:hypothetical protein